MKEDDRDDVDDDGGVYFVFVWHLFALEGKFAVQQRDLCIISTNSVFYLRFGLIALAHDGSIRLFTLHHFVVAMFLLHFLC